MTADGHDDERRESRATGDADPENARTASTGRTSPAGSTTGRPLSPDDWPMDDDERALGTDVPAAPLDVDDDGRPRAQDDGEKDSRAKRRPGG